MYVLLMQIILELRHVLSFWLLDSWKAESYRIRDQYFKFPLTIRGSPNF